MTVRTDGELVADYAATGSEAAFAELVARHKPAIYRACLRLLGNETDAEGAAQAVFLELVRKCRVQHSEGASATRLHRLAKGALMASAVLLAVQSLIVLCGGVLTLWALTLPGAAGAQGLFVLFPLWTYTGPLEALILVALTVLGALKWKARHLKWAARPLSLEKPFAFLAVAAVLPPAALWGFMWMLRTL